MAKTSSNQGNKQVVKWAEALAQLVRETKMSELRLENGTQSLRLRRREDGDVPFRLLPVRRARPPAAPRWSTRTLAHR
jgi:hypothetical protein